MPLPNRPPHGRMFGKYGWTGAPLWPATLRKPVALHRRPPVIVALCGRDGPRPQRKIRANQIRKRVEKHFSLYAAGNLGWHQNGGGKLMFSM